MQTQCGHKNGNIIYPHLHIYTANHYFGNPDMDMNKDWIPRISM